MSRVSRWLLLLALLFPAWNCFADDHKLQIYFIDTEGGAATLIVTPAGQSVLIDTGNPGNRDPGRIVEAAKDAGITDIDDCIITHYHIDHMGGAPTLAKLMPIHTLYDNDDQNVSRDKPSPEYLATKCDNRIMINPGDELPLKQAPAQKDLKLTIRCLGARKKFVDPPAGAPENPFCKDAKGKAIDLTDNANSIVTLLSYGDFRFFVAGDLTWNMEHEFACPVNRAGTVDLYQVTHHGLDLSNNPVLVKALAPTVAIMSNGPYKGCEPGTLATLQSLPSLQALFTLHKNLRIPSNNTVFEHIANIGTGSEDKGNFIRVTVDLDSENYTVSMPANDYDQSFQTRKHD